MIAGATATAGENASAGANAAPSETAATVGASETAGASAEPLSLKVMKTTNDTVGGSEPKRTYGGYVEASCDVVPESAVGWYRIACAQSMGMDAA